MLLVIMGLAVAFNVLIIYWKFTHNRNADGALDSAALFIVATTFGGSEKLLMIGTIASVVISMWFLAFPPNFTSKKNNEPTL